MTDKTIDDKTDGINGSLSLNRATLAKKLAPHKLRLSGRKKIKRVIVKKIPSSHILQNTPELKTPESK